MKDPTPDNITGSKTVSHTVNHTIRWDYMVIAVAGLYAFYKFSQWFESSETGAESLENGYEVLVEGNNQDTGLGTEV